MSISISMWNIFAVFVVMTFLEGDSSEDFSVGVDVVSDVEVV